MIDSTRVHRFILAMLCALCFATAPAYSEEPVSRAVSAEPAKPWQTFAEQVDQVTRRIHQLADRSRTAQQRGEVDQALLTSLVEGALYFAQMDPDYPDWLPFNTTPLLFTDPNPDAVYYITRIRGSGVYRITGTRGTVKLIDLQINKGFVGFNDSGPTLRNVNFNDLKIAKDGTFEIVLSASRPAGYKGNWVQLDAAVDDTFLLIRQISYDWLHEVDGRFAIQRIDKPIDQPRKSAEEMSRRIEQIPGYIDRLARAMIRILEVRDPGKQGINQLVNVSGKMDNQASNKNQDYYVATLGIAADEALVVEAEIPRNCPYWSVQLMDSFMNVLDYMYHQTGLNGHTAHVDRDGKVRVVISRQDPGVANWLDTGDYEMTRVIWRWYQCSGVPTARKVALADIGKSLYPGTKAISLEQRQEMLRQRVTGAQLRRRW